VKNDFVMPVLVLTLICLIISGALAVTNTITEPVIANGAEQRESLAMKEIMPQGDGFEPLDTSGLPAAIGEAYRTTNNVGYVFVATVAGYGGDIELICGLNADGKIIHNKVLKQSETEGLGARIAENPFSDQFDGIDKSQLDSVDTITGATISSKAYINAIRDVFTAFDIIKEADK